MTWVKICGTTNLEDALLAADAGVDALGFVFAEKSPRRVSAKTVREIVKQLPGGIEKVGVFVNKYEDEISEIVDGVGLTAVQLHGNDEDPHVADLILKKRPDLKVLVAVSMKGIPVRKNVSFKQTEGSSLQTLASSQDGEWRPEGWAMMWNPDSVFAFVLDSGTAEERGGTGQVFDWASAGEGVDVIKRLGKIIVAGGLNSQNVQEAIRILNPWGVDVVSGVEREPGKKDPEKLKQFVRTVREFKS